MLTIQQEKKNRQIALVITVGIHALLLIAFIYLFVWEAPNPPWDTLGGGVELNFGTDPAGYGDIQSMADANASLNTEDSKAGKPETAPVKQPVQETRAEPEAQENIRTTDMESPAEVKAVEKPTEKKVDKKVETPEPPKKVEPKPQPKVDKRAVMNDGGSGNGTSGTSNKPTGNNNGDKPGTVGDQGDRRGTLEGKALYGDPGSGGGNGSGNGSGTGSYNITGWVPDFKPKVVDNSSEEGIVKFRVKIDDQGNLLSVTIIEKTVSQAVAEIYKKEVEKLTFSSTSDNPSPAPTSSGTITFIIKSR